MPHQSFQPFDFFSRRENSKVGVFFPRPVICLLFVPSTLAGFNITDTLATPRVFRRPMVSLNIKDTLLENGTVCIYGKYRPVSACAYMG